MRTRVTDVRDDTALPMCSETTLVHLTLLSTRGSAVKTLPTMQETQVQSLGWEDWPGEGHGNPLCCSYLGNSMDRGAWCGLPSTRSQRVGHDSETKQLTVDLKVVKMVNFILCAFLTTQTKQLSLKMCLPIGLLDGWSQLSCVKLRTLNGADWTWHKCHLHQQTHSFCSTLHQCMWVISGLLWHLFYLFGVSFSYFSSPSQFPISCMAFLKANCFRSFTHSILKLFIIRTIKIIIWTFKKRLAAHFSVS